MASEDLASNIQLYSTRWTLAFVVILGGCQAGFSVVDLGAWSDFVAAHFHVSHETVDWVILAAFIGGLASVLPIALICLKYTDYIKHLIVGGFLVFGLSFLLQGFAFHSKLPVWTLAIGQFWTGVGSCLFYASAPLLATVWFAEGEQATVFGFAWFSVAAGKFLASSLPAIINGIPLPLDGSPEENGIKVTLWIFAGMDIVISVLIVRFLPNLPPLPPSAAESRRLELRMNATSWCEVSYRLATETKAFITDKTTIGLMLTFNTYLSMYLILFMMMPISDASHDVTLPESHANSTPVLYVIETSGLQRSNALMAISIGSLLGSIPAGLLLDRVKKYNPMANLISMSVLTSGILMFIGAYYLELSLLYIACGMYGLFTFAANCFFVEIIKQYVYPKIFETNFGLIVANSSNILVLVYSPIMRQILQHFGSLWFYITFCLILMCAEIVTLCVKPDLKRFLYESESSALLRNFE